MPRRRRPKLAAPTLAALLMILGVVADGGAQAPAASAPDSLTAADERTGAARERLDALWEDLTEILARGAAQGIGIPYPRLEVADGPKPRFHQSAPEETA